MKKILIVDDDNGVRRLLLSFLKRKGFESIGAENGKRALEKIEKQPDIALVVTDIDMPVMNGFELIEELNGKIPVLLMSGSISSLDKAEEMNFPRLVGRLEKVFSLDEFIKIIQKNLK